MNKSRGRPRGHPATRAQIADAARELFVRHGYRGTTIRAIAVAAGVDSALISYHFGSKQGLFGEVMRLHCAQSVALSDALAGDRAGLADRLLRAVTDVWDTGAWDSGASGGVDPAALRLLPQYLETEMLRQLAEYLGGPDATERATAVVTVIGGLIQMRYLLPLPSAATLSAAQVRRMLGPALRAALQGHSRVPVGSGR
jgi:AcrR family transcriptional regulator